MNSLRNLKLFTFLLLLSFVSPGCKFIDNVVQPISAKAGETITIMVNATIPQTKTSPANRIIFAYLVPRDWNAAANSVITYTSGRGNGKMTLMPPGKPATGFDRDWPGILMSRFKMGPNQVRDMEWVTFQSDTTYPSVEGSPGVKGIIKIVTTVGKQNEIVRPGYFVGTGDGIDPENNPVYGNDLHIVGGKGQLLDFSHPEQATIVPARSVDNDYITITFDGNVRPTSLTASTTIFLQAKAFTKDGQVIQVVERNATTRLAPLGDNKWSIQIWPRAFFRLKKGQSLSKMEYYFTNRAGDKANYDQPGNPFVFEFSNQF
jgi:hypothetical protein